MTLETALFNYESGGFDKTSRRHEFGKLAAAFAHLTTAGLLTQIHGRDGEHLGVHTLTIPPHRAPSTRATDPGA